MVGSLLGTSSVAFMYRQSFNAEANTSAIEALSSGVDLIAVEGETHVSSHS